MATLTKQRWLITDVVTGRRRQTRYLMTPEEAREVDPKAEPVPGTERSIVVPDNPMETFATSSWQRAKG